MVRTAIEYGLFDERRVPDHVTDHRLPTGRYIALIAGMSGRFATDRCRL
jgi:hypothetical protein